MEEIPTSFTVVSASIDAIPHVGYFKTDVEALRHLVPDKVVLVTRDNTATENSHTASGILGMHTAGTLGSSIDLFQSRRTRVLDKIAVAGS